MTLSITNILVSGNVISGTGYREFAHPAVNENFSGIADYINNLLEELGIDDSDPTNIRPPGGKWSLFDKLGIGTENPSHELDIEKNGESASVGISTDSATGGDSLIQFNARTGTSNDTSWAIGLDNSDSDKLNIGVRTDGAGAGPNDNVAVSITTAGETSIGDIANSDYSLFEADGTYEANGDATVWDDQQVNLGTVKQGSSAPSETYYQQGWALLFRNSQANEIRFNAQFSHKLKIGSTIEFHLHTAPDDNTGGNVRWQFKISFADINGNFSNTTTYLATQTIAANSQDDHLLFEITSTIGSTAGDVSSIALCNLIRLGGDALDTLNADINLVALDFHIECNTMGSRTETSK